MSALTDRLAEACRAVAEDPRYGYPYVAGYLQGALAYGWSPTRTAKALEAIAAEDR